MATTTKESWRTMIVQRGDTEKLKDAQFTAYKAYKGEIEKKEFENTLSGFGISIIGLVFKSQAQAATISGLLYTVLRGFSPSEKQVHANGVFYGYEMFREMSDYMDKYNYKALQVSAYNMQYTTPSGSYSLLFGNTSGKQLNASFKVTGVLTKEGHWIYA
jgi:uncharacterized radical SAM superfamily Fe-S cluster-containing enzyme